MGRLRDGGKGGEKEVEMEDVPCQARGLMTVIPVLWKAEVGGLCDPRSSRLQLVMIRPVKIHCAPAWVT